MKLVNRFVGVVGGVAADARWVLGWTLYALAMSRAGHRGTRGGKS